MSTEEVAVKDAEYFMAHPEEFDALSDADQNAFMFGGTPQGEIKSEASPDLADAKKDSEPAKVEEPAKVDQVVQAKDGVHVIPFSELEAARDKAARLEQTAQDQARLIEDLKAAKELDAETGGTKAQEDVMAEYSGEYPELMEDMRPFLEKMMSGEIKRQVDAFKAEVSKDLQPIKDKEEDEARDAHFATIAETHPDYQEVGASDTLRGWIDSKPAFIRSQYDAVLSKGTAEEVVEVLDEFRRAHPAEKPADGKGPDAAALAKMAEEKLKGVPDVVPASLSDAPGGAAVHHDETEAMADMSPLALMARFNSMSPDKIEEKMSRLI